MFGQIDRLGRSLGRFINTPFRKFPLHLEGLILPRKSRLKSKIFLNVTTKDAQKAADMITADSFD